MWTLEKRGHQVQARVRTSSLGLELRIMLDGELWWSQVVRPATDDALTAAAEQKLEAFEAKGWRHPDGGPTNVRTD